jgi:TetR/AcrR family transcriptional regulator, transcriptional repressor for nem operon
MTFSKTRDRLIATAMQMFWQKGYASTSVADILQEAGANSGSLYHFFPGKQDLLLAVLGRYREGIGPMLLEPAWRDEKDPIEKVFALLARYRQAIVQTDHTYGCPIGGLALEIHEPDPAVREALAANFAAWTDAVRECLEEAGNRLPMRLDRKELAEFILTVMEGGVMQSRTHRSVAYFDGSVRHLRRYVDQLQREADIERRLAINPSGAKRRPKSVVGKRAK